MKKKNLEGFFVYWKKKCDKGEVSALDRNEVRILKIYVDWLEKK